MGEIGDTSQGKIVAEVIKQIGFINIKKIPGNPVTFGLGIEDAYSRDKEILLRQIYSFEPNIIITGSIYNCGTTLKLLLNDLGVSSERLITPNIDSSIEYVIDKNRIIISA